LNGSKLDIKALVKYIFSNLKYDVFIKCQDCHLKQGDRIFAATAEKTFY